MPGYLFVTAFPLEKEGSFDCSLIYKHNFLLSYAQVYFSIHKPLSKLKDQAKKYFLTILAP
jgi:hypothetical protein